MFWCAKSFPLEFRHKIHWWYWLSLTEKFWWKNSVSNAYVFLFFVVVLSFEMNLCHHVSFCIVRVPTALNSKPWMMVNLFSYCIILSFLWFYLLDLNLFCMIDGVKFLWLFWGRIWVIKCSICSPYHC